MSGRGRGGPPRGGGRGGYVYNSATRLPEDRDVQEGRQSHSKAAAVGLPPRIGTYDDRPGRGSRGRGRGAGGGGPPPGPRGRDGGGPPPPPSRPRDSGYPRADAYRPGRAADTYRPAEETYPRANLPSRPPPPHMSSAPRRRTEPEAGPSISSAYNPPSPYHTRFDRAAPSRQNHPPPTEGDYSPPSPVQQHYDELQDDIKPVVSRPPTPPLMQPAPVSRPVPPAPAARPKPAAPPDPHAEALKKMQRFKPGASSRAQSDAAAVPPVPVASTSSLAGKNGDIKPTKQQLEESTASIPFVDDPSRPEGVLALSYAELPTEVRAKNVAVKKAAREKFVSEQTKVLAGQGRQPVKGGVRWRDDGFSMDWEKRREPTASVASGSTVPTTAARLPSEPVAETSRTSGFGADPGKLKRSITPEPASTPKSSAKAKGKRDSLGPHGTPPPNFKPKTTVKKPKQLTAPEDKFPHRPESISTEIWNTMTSKNRKAARIAGKRKAKAEGRVSYDTAAARETPKKAKKRAVREESLDTVDSSSGSSSIDQPLVKRKKTASATPAEAKPRLTPSIRNTLFPTPTPSDPDLAALARIAELETTLDNKVTEIDRWTKMQKDYPHMQKKTQLQIEGLQDEIARLFDEIGRLKGRE